MNEIINTRTQYLVSLIPNNDLCTKIYELQKDIIKKDLSSFISKSEIYTTVFGFYSEFQKINYDSKDLLEKDILNDFERISSMITKSDDILIKGSSCYNSNLVLTLESPILNSLHNMTLNLLTNFIVLKGGIPATKDLFYFGQRYPYVKNQYSPHISICKNISQTPFSKELEELYYTTFSFSQILLSKKEEGMWNNLSSIYLK